MTSWKTVLTLTGIAGFKAGDTGQGQDRFPRSHDDLSEQELVDPGQLPEMPMTSADGSMEKTTMVAVAASNPSISLARGSSEPCKHESPSNGGLPIRGDHTNSP